MPPSQDFTTYSGDSANIALVAYDPELGTPFNLTGIADIVWNAARDAETAPVITKSMTGGNITVTNAAAGQFTLALVGADTTPLSAFYVHEARTTDDDGNVVSVTFGRMQVGRTPSWSYSGNPANSARDAVRNYIGDVVEATPQLMDPEIDYILVQYPNVLLAAAMCCRTLGNRYATKVNKRVGDLSINYSDIAKGYMDRADELERQGNMIGVTVYGGGISKSDALGNDMNPDRIKIPFRIRQFDNRGASGGNMPANIGPPDY
jgi:hypothetical protein